MKPDPSLPLLDLYSAHPEATFAIQLVSGEVLYGAVSGFVKGNPQLDEPYVLQWHIVNPGDGHSLGLDILGNAKGRLINQDDILSMTRMNNLNHPQP